ncbi:TetR/AcrR family transcriptional regulator [Aeromicrobium sp. 50.2.37]|uniref:TetR/AcrR family transcriptional regulator n=1 Tax=Aeromicrobium sp. 50.2.37 TaxID=2969305 RepID=UPI00214F8BD8|nr:TetR/AcrR family transcriptional regulator [Aeromicrobium sp. 50.2.37]MCR4515037.1 TetR/AcrR family transcriptional regulator [Aeromicrobium sp. 50.2.37]
MQDEDQDQDAGRARQAEIRQRILAGLEDVLARRPFGEIAVADIVGSAGMSKRAFYEVYPHKAACLVDHAERFHRRWVQALEQRVLDAPDRLAGAEVAVRAVLVQTRSRPLLARAHLVDIYSLGPDAVLVRRGMKRLYATMLQNLAAADDGTEKVDLDDETALRIVGAVDDVLVALAFDEVDDAEFERRLQSTVALVRAVFVGLWIEQSFGPIDLNRLAAGASRDDLS